MIPLPLQLPVLAVKTFPIAAGGKKLGIFSANIGAQLLRLGLIDEIDIHVVPVPLGAGTESTDSY